MKVLIMGLDGASLDVLMPWVQSGHLPGFARLIQQGGKGALESVPNMRSAAAWTSFQTGKNPGKHGIFEFYERVPCTYDIRFINARTRDGRSFFKIASDAGKRVSVINVPMSYPAEEVNGAFIAGLDGPGKQSEGFTWPRGLLTEVESHAGEYVIEPGLTGCIVNGDVDSAVELLLQEIESKKRTSRYLMTTYPWDLFVTIFRSTDAVHHCFWKYFDTSHPQYDPAEGARYGDVILRAYRAIDAFVEEILAALEDDTLVLVLSDHGCGPKHPANNQLNPWLAGSGYLAYEATREGPGSPLSRLLGAFYKWTIAKTPRSTKELLWRLFPAFRDRVQSRLCFTGIDWQRTRAFSDTLFPTIWINVKGREPQGIVGPGREYEQVCREIKQALLECRDEVSGQPIVEKVFQRDEIYSGPHVDKAPDLLVRWREDTTIRGIRVPGQGDGKNPAMERASTPFIPGEDYRIISGDHRLNGLLLFCGPAKGGARNPLREACLLDVAPTVLYALGLPVPDDMDGRVLLELFDDAYVKDHPIRYERGEARQPAARAERSDYQDPEEEEQVKERLRGLGYLE